MFIFFLGFFSLTFSKIVFDIKKLKVNYFKENKKLYYVNAINDDKGNIYFEIWGENNNNRYFIGKNSDTEEPLLFNEKEILSVDAKVASNYHESIIVNYNNKINIFSFDYQYIYFINLQNELISSKEINKTISDYQNYDYFSYRNSVIKLKNNNYLLSISFRTKSSFTCRLFNCQYLKLLIFNFTSNDINGFNFVNTNALDNFENLKSKNCNSTICFETDKLFIQCFYISEKAIFNSNEFTIYIFTKDLKRLNSDINFGYFYDSTFTKIFHLKKEIGVYILFDTNNSTRIPKIFLEKLDSKSYDLSDLLEFECNSCSSGQHRYIILNAKDKFILDDCLFCSDAIKINDSKFVVILTIKNTKDLLICLFDLYNNDSSLRLRYYKLELSLINVLISVNLRTFIFKNYFGLLFYDSYSNYPGYIFFNYPNITSENKKNRTTIEIKLFVNSPKSYYFSISENLEIINNLYGGLEKIKILNYSPSSNTGVIIKSKKLNSEISLNQNINMDDTLIFDQSSEGAFPGNYTLEFIPITSITNENDNSIQTNYFGNAKENDFDGVETFSKEIYKLIYNIECYEKCKTCTQLGKASFYFCVKCVEQNFQSINNGEKCICKDFKFINDKGQNLCIKTCEEGQYQYIISENDKYCLNSCEFNGEKLYKDDLNKIFLQKQCIHYFDENLGINQCIENDTCPSSYPYLKKEENECVSDCKIDEISKNLCYYCSENNNIKNETGNTNQIEMLKNIKKEIKNDLNTTNLDQNGKNIIIKDENVIYTITSTKIQQNLKNIPYNMTVIDLSECENKLISNNIIQKDKNLYILKLDIDEEGKKTPKVEYEVYYYPENSTNLELLDLSLCANTRIDIIKPINIDQNEIDKYNTSSDYYNNICKSFSESGADLTLKDRQKKYDEKSLGICEEKCDFSEYDYKLGKAVCSCLTKTKMDDLSDMKLNTTRLYLNFKKIANIANLEIIECGFLIFNKKEIIKNIANYIMTSIFLMSIVTLIIFIFKGYKKIKNLIEEIVKAKKVKKKEKNNGNNKRKPLKNVIRRKTVNNRGILSLNSVSKLNLNKKESNQFNSITISGKKENTKNKNQKIKTNKFPGFNTIN